MGLKMRYLVALALFVLGVITFVVAFGVGDLIPAVLGLASALVGFYLLEEEDNGHAKR